VIPYPVLSVLPVKSTTCFMTLPALCPDPAPLRRLRMVSRCPLPSTAESQCCTGAPARQRAHLIPIKYRKEVGKHLVLNFAHGNSLTRISSGRPQFVL
jgi:hypothetical protein